MERAGSDLTAFGETVVFLDYFKDLPDPRQAGKVIYPLPEVLLLCLLAVLGKTVCPHVARWLALHCASEGCSGRPSRSSPQEDEPWGILPIFS